MIEPYYPLVEHEDVENQEVEKDAKNRAEETRIMQCKHVIITLRRSSASIGPVPECLPYSVEYELVPSM